MEPITIYRVENSRGHGLYRPRHAVGLCVMCERRHVLPDDDDLLKDHFEKGFHQFGFNSLKQLKFWIYKKEWRDTLRDKGFFISIIEAVGIRGDTQAIFDPDTRKDIGILSLDNV